MKKIRPQHPEELRVPAVEFVGEQDGPSEQILKDRLESFFVQDKSVHRAYLAKIRIGSAESVALCIRSEFGADRGIAEKVGTIFRGVFRFPEHLDILFLGGLQEERLQQVCIPFFIRRRQVP